MNILKFQKRKLHMTQPNISKYNKRWYDGHIIVFAFIPTLTGKLAVYFSFFFVIFLSNSLHIIFN